MTHYKSDIEVPKTLADSVLTGLEKGSAFQKLMTQVPLDGNGRIITVLGQEDAAWVGEGGVKPVIEADKTQLELISKKLARVSLFSDELANDIPALRKAIEDEVEKSLARTADKTWAGLVTAPAGFNTFAGADTATITDYATFRAAIATKTGYPTDGFALNTFELDRLHGLVTTAGVPALRIEGDYTSGTINGIPYFVFQGGTAPLGYAGPFKRAMYGIVAGSAKVTILEETAELPSGEVIALKQRNLIGVLAEVRIGSLVPVVTDFTKLGSISVSS